MCTVFQETPYLPAASACKARFFSQGYFIFVCCMWLLSTCPSIFDVLFFFGRHRWTEDDGNMLTAKGTIHHPWQPSRRSFCDIDQCCHLERTSHQRQPYFPHLFTFGDTAKTTKYYNNMGNSARCVRSSHVYDSGGAQANLVVMASKYWDQRVRPPPRQQRECSIKINADTTHWFSLMIDQ